jgi:hypothetical protein
MWLERNKLDLVKDALRKGESVSIDLVLRDVLNQTDTDVPTTCPQCHKDLVRKGIPYLEMFTSVCPDGHGAWLSADNGRKLREFIERECSQAGRRRHQVMMLRAAGFFLGMVAIFMQVPQMLHKHLVTGITRHVADERGQKIGESFWPARDFSNWNPLPIKESVIDRQDELVYFQKWIEIMNDGVVNRLNMQEVLDTRRAPEDYTAVYQVFSAKQNDFLDRLSELEPPLQLEKFHRDILDATESQIAFYREYAERKSSDSSLKLGQLLENPRLKDTNELLWAAYHEFQHLYPNVDTATNNAIEQRLCWLDMI